MKKGLLIAGLPLLMFVLLFCVPLAPSGKFAMPTIASEGDAFLLFKDGKVSVLVKEGKTERSTTVGVFEKKDGQWILEHSDGEISPIRCAPLWIQFKRPDGRWDKCWRVFF